MGVDQGLVDFLQKRLWPFKASQEGRIGKIPAFGDHGAELFARGADDIHGCMKVP